MRFCTQVKARAEELKRSLDDVVDALSAGGAAVTWDVVLSRYSILNMHYANMSEQLKGVMKAFAVFPKMIDHQSIADSE
jgi:hypothetical protein